MNRQPYPSDFQPPPMRGLPAHGYRLSSDDLQAGLDVSTLPVSAVPVDLLQELARLRRCWETAPTKP